MLPEQFKSLVTEKSGLNSVSLLIEVPIVGDRQAWMAAVARQTESSDLANYHLYVSESDIGSGAFISHLWRVDHAAELQGITVPGVLGDVYAKVRLKDDVYNVAVHIGGLLFEAQRSI